MEETRDDDTSSAEALHPDPTWWQSDYEEKSHPKSLNSVEVASCSTASSSEHEQHGLAAQRASQILWATGKLSEPIPDGFYFITPERRFKELFDRIPPLDELYSLDSDGLRPSVIVVDTHKDKKLAMLKQLSLSLVKGLRSNPTAMIKKIAGLVCDIFKRQNTEGVHVKGALEEVSKALDNQGVHLLGQIKHGSCRSRAILFKVLADSAGLDSQLMVGLRKEGETERADSFKHMSVIVVLDSVEMLVDLSRCPGKLVSCSMRAILLSHIASIGDIESMENDSYGSPVDSSSSACGFPDQADYEGIEYAESFQSYQHKLEASMNVSGRSLRSIILQAKATTEQKLNLSHSEPNVANSFWRRSQKKVVVEQGTAISSPEHPLYQRRLGRSILGGQRYFFKDYSDDINSSRSAGASPVESRRRSRRCVSMIPEIGDDIVRVVRAMNETLKQSRVSKDPAHLSYSCSTSERDDCSDIQDYVPEILGDEHDGLYSENGPVYNLRRKQANSQKAMSLPSSPQHFMRGTSVIGEGPEIFGGPHMVPIINKVLDAAKILNKPLLPFDEWNIDFSEISVGTRVGIGFFGEVFRGTWNGIEVAIKVFLEQDSTVENIEDFCNEISILSRVRHPNVILFLGACTKPPHLSIVTEYMDMGSLYYLIHVSGQKKKLSWRRKLKMLCSICRGLMCIHRMKIAHRDVKSANCLVNKHWTVKICDFGLSRFLTTRPMKDASSAGTPEWMAPELIRNEPFTEKCDIFSLGVIIWEMCTLTRPWEGVPSAQVVYAVANDGKRLQIPEGPLGELISDCWAEPDDRPSCQEVLARLINCEYMLC